MNERLIPHEKIMVTGSDGFIGSRVSNHLQSRGYDVFGLSRRGRNGAQGDITNINQINSIINDVQPKAIVHCAGLTPHVHVQDEDYIRVNFQGSKILLNAACDNHIHFINASTVGVYGQPLSDDGIVYESDKCKPLSPYAQSKYDFENYLCEQGRDNHINMRIANIPGRDAFINYVVNNRRVQFNGDEPYIRDYIHPDDLSRLFEKSIVYLMSGGKGRTVNAGSGVGFSFHDIVKEIENQTGMMVERTVGGVKTGDVVKIICDISTTQQVLNWTPQYTILKDIINYALLNKHI